MKSRFLDEKDLKNVLVATVFVCTVKDDQCKRLVRLPITFSVHRTKNSSRGLSLAPTGGRERRRDRGGTGVVGFWSCVGVPDVVVVLLLGSASADRSPRLLVPG